ncbi:SUMF1/EgtB/PvdO family nonheme iron enzyme [Nocardiopsis sp. RV163]|uniref:formylglycine-generating enzyme family protein n=1 Tax=Nocardiopsis sp. RV163 TaxID=1661388 RepID=UPI00064BB19D
MIEIPAGEIVLRDEGTMTDWKAEVGAFLLAPCPVTRDLYAAVVGEGHGRDGVLRARGREVVGASPGVAGAADGVGAAGASDGSGAADMAVAADTPGAAGPRTPVTEVSWLDAVRFCDLLSRAEGLEPCYSGGDGPDALDVVCDWNAGGYRLPSEAEWEYACRAGSSDVRYGELDEIGWYRSNSGGGARDVATRAPNAWGLYDTIGNVWEWCWDVYDPAVYGPYRVFRGGGWNDHPRGCRAACRRKSHPTLRVDDLGFRLARSM